MLKRVAIGLAACAVLLTAAPAPAHHAFSSELDVEKPLQLQGVVTVMEWVNPHSWIHIDVKNPQGTLNWMVEGGIPWRAEAARRAGDDGPVLALARLHEERAAAGHGNRRVGLSGEGRHQQGGRPRPDLCGWKKTVPE